jgi:GDP-L-fucose synthase
MKFGKVFVAGHNGMVGSAILSELQKQNFASEIILADRRNLDLLNKNDVYQFLKNNKPDYLIIAAAKVGGIHANSKYPVDFLLENISIQTNLISGAFQNSISKLIFLGSSCIYPKYAEQPIKEDCLLSGKLEQTNEPYALAKIAGIKLCEAYNKQYKTDYRSLMPCNLYGPGDNYHPLNSHVIPGLISRMHTAKLEKKSKFNVWGTGKPLREFLYVDDVAKATLHVMKIDDDEYQRKVISKTSHLNVGSGEEISINELSHQIANIIGYKGDIVFDENQPDGTPRKVLDISLIKSLGWAPKINLIDGLKKTYTDFKKN